MSQLMRETGASNLESQFAISSFADERRGAEDRRDCYWLYVVTGCKAEANRFQLVGVTLGGRKLKIIFQLKANNIVRIITGWRF
jgi:hypothetical protein